MPKRHAAVVQEVHKFHAKDRAEEGRVRQGRRADSLGKVAKVGAKNTEPLQYKTLEAVARPVLFEKQGIDELTRNPKTGKVAAIASEKTSAKNVGGYLVASLKVWWI